MHPDFWHERWRTGQIGFHAPDYHPALLATWPGLGLASGSRVFVPLCGRSLDMVWLAARGHEVVGIELSPLAVADFFAHEKLTPQVERRGALERWRAGRYELLCGDFFELGHEALGDIAAWYDRAALVALPLDLRRRYVERMAALLPCGARGLLVTVDYDQARMDGPPFSVPPVEVEALHAGAFDVAPLTRHDCLPDNPRFRERGLDAMFESSFRLTRR